MIYVVKHSDDMYIPLMKNYKIINVGKLYEDDGRDNINYLNPYINETTALYDLWKNYNDEIIGMTHYRRLFITNEYNALNFDMVKEFLKQVDLISTPIHDLGEYTINNYLTYSLKITDHHTLTVLEKYINKLGKVDPKIVTYFNTRHGFIARNMFVARKEIIDQYCKWLFSFII